LGIAGPSVRQLRRFDEVVLPVYRIVLKDDEQTRYYLDPSTGLLLQRADSTGRWRRWLISGLHRLDFMEWMRGRPLRDVLMWLTLLGGLVASATGVYRSVASGAISSSWCGRCIDSPQAPRTETNCRLVVIRAIR
jgi:hypothetical protein